MPKLSSNNSILIKIDNHYGFLVEDIIKFLVQNKHHGTKNDRGVTYQGWTVASEGGILHINLCSNLNLFTEDIGKHESSFFVITVYKESMNKANRG